jgi:hypothetical protein
MYQGVSLPEVVKEFVAKPLSLVRIRDQSGHIEDLYPHESRAILAVRILRLARFPEYLMGALRPDEPDPHVRLDGRERIGGDLRRRQRQS